MYPAYPGYLDAEIFSLKSELPRKRSISRIHPDTDQLSSLPVAATLQK